MLIRGVAFCLAFACAISAWASPSWTLEKDSSGVKVYILRTRDDDKPYSFRATATFAASKKRVLALLLAPKHYPAWLANCAKAYRLKSLGAHSFLSYNELALPWPANNRDYILRAQVESAKADGVTRIVFQAVPYASIPARGRVRIHNLQGYWRLQTLKSGHEVQLVYEVHFDPRGTLPQWMIDHFLINHPFQTMINLRHRLSR